MTAATFEKETRISGSFLVPHGVVFDGTIVADSLGRIIVSTVCIDPASELYETSVFLDVPPKIAAYCVKFAGPNSASDGHDWTVRRILDTTLPLAIPITYLADGITK